MREGQSIRYVTPKYTASWFWSRTYVGFVEALGSNNVKVTQPHNFPNTKKIRFRCNNDTNPGKIWNNLFTCCVNRMAKMKKRSLPDYYVIREGSKVRIMSGITARFDYVKLLQARKNTFDTTKRKLPKSPDGKDNMMQYY